MGLRLKKPWENLQFFPKITTNFNFIQLLRARNQVPRHGLQTPGHFPATPATHRLKETRAVTLHATDIPGLSDIRNLEPSA